MENQQLKLLQKFENDSQWFHQNIDKLRSQDFTGKFVAISGGQLIASDKDINLVIKNVEKKGENPSFVFMEFVHPKGYTLLL